MPEIHKDTIQLDILNDILKERNSQDKQWGTQEHSYEMWNAILGEEVGEAAKEVVELGMGNTIRTHNLRSELIQVAAVAVAMIEQIDTDEASWQNPDVNPGTIPVNVSG